MPVGYTVMWLLFTAVYAVWMIFFMNDIVLNKYASTAERTIDGVLHEDITGMLGNEWLYPVWVALSCALMLMFIVYIKRLYFSEPKNSDKIFCIISLILGFVFVTVYGFFKNPLEYTASMIGLDYPWHFRMWGVFASLSVFANTMYLYRKFGYYSKAGIISGSVGSAAIFVTINVPSAGEELVLNSLRCMSHWSGALIFAFCCAAPIVLFLLNRAKTKDKKFIALFAVYTAILVLMLVLLATVGKNGLIENLPMWATYILMFMLNFTSIFDSKKTADAEKQTVTI